MSEHTITKGKDIKLKGAAAKEIKEILSPSTVAVQPLDFRGLRARLSVKEGDTVKLGSPIFADKTNPDIQVLAPASGTVKAINRGAKRALLEIVIERGSSSESVEFKKYSSSEISQLSADQVREGLLAGGLWVSLRQRPFSKVAHTDDKPKSIFVHAMSTEPLAADSDFVLEGQEALFQTGLDIISKLTDGKTYLCTAFGAKSKALTQAKNVEIHKFAGPHPAGNVSTHIHAVDPINKGDVVWYIEAQDVVRVARLFTEGRYPAERVVALTGEGAKDRFYAKTLIGAPVAELFKGSDLTGMRCISGSILSGRAVGGQGFLGNYDSQITIIPEGGRRELLGWLMPGANKYTFSRTFLSAVTLKGKEASLDTDENGGHRAIVLNNVYDRYVPLDIMTYFLLRAVLAGDIEEAESLGILECDEEDFALCTFACPSKTDVGAIIRQGLDLIEQDS